LPGRGSGLNGLFCHARFCAGNLSPSTLGHMHFH
jgi:hypothetical protein